MVVHPTAVAISPTSLHITPLILRPKKLSCNLIYSFFENVLIKEEGPTPSTQLAVKFCRLTRLKR